MQPPATSRTNARPIAEAEAEAKAVNTIAQNFDKFWLLYPKSIGKKNSYQQWVKLNPDDSLVKKILIAVKTQSQTEQWQKDGGKYIPHPERFLKHRRWEDETDIDNCIKETNSQLAFDRILKENQDSSAYPLTLVDLLINNAQNSIC